MSAPDYTSLGITAYCFDCLWPLRKETECPCCGSTDLVTTKKFFGVEE